MKNHHCCGNKNHGHPSGSNPHHEADASSSSQEDPHHAAEEYESSPLEEEGAHTHSEGCCAHKAEDTPNSTDYIQQMQAEMARGRNENLMLLAEMDNYRKRLLKEKQETSRNATERLISELLTPVDQFEGALASATNMSDEVRNWAFGFNMILNQIKDVFGQHHVSSFDALNALYDPYLHEAIDTLETTDYPEGTIVKQYFRGYKIGDKVLRPAKVQVVKHPTENTNT